MHRRRARLLALCPMLVLILLVPRPATATPPTPPLDFVLRLLDTPVPGRPVRYSIEVTSLVPIERLSVRMVPPGGVTLVAGDTARTARDLAPGHARRFEGTLRVTPGRRHFVYVRAEATTPSGRVWTRGGHLVVLAGPLAVPDPAARIVPDGKGGDLVEYAGQPAGPAR